MEEIPLKGPAGRLRARMSVDKEEEKGGGKEEEEEIDVVRMVRFCLQGSSMLSSVSLQQSVSSNSEKPDFYVVNQCSWFSLSFEIEIVESHLGSRSKTVGKLVEEAPSCFASDFFMKISISTPQFSSFLCKLLIEIAEKVVGIAVLGGF